MSVFSILQDRWNEILLSIKEDYDLSNASFRAWIEPSVLDSVIESENAVVISFPYAKASLDLVEKKYSIAYRVKIEEFSGFRCDKVLLVSSLKDEEKKEEEPEIYIPTVKKPSISDENYKATNLKEKYTFDSFVVGSNNKMAHAASLAVAENPGNIYNPLFIYGGAGLGKTHLMHAIGNFVIKNDPSKKVLYIPSETFTSELVEAIRNKDGFTTSDFRNRYRDVDVLLIDDIQFIIDKDRTIEEFFHTFNELYNLNKAIVISSDRSPKEFTINLESRIVSRFEWGLPVDIGAPDYETRVAILRKKEEMENYHIDNSVIQFIAENVKSNIRELEGSLNRVVAASKLMGNKDGSKEITLEFAENILSDFLSPEKSEKLTPATLLNIIADHFMITVEDIKSTKRNKEVMMPRQIAMYLCREELGMKQEAIGNLLGKDHSTIIYGIKKINDELDKDEAVRATMEALRKKLSAYNR